MAGCHAFDFETSAAMGALQHLVTQRFSAPREESIESFGEFETQLLSTLMSLGRDLLAAELQRLDVDVPGVVVGSDRFRRREKTMGRYETLLGRVCVKRWTYRGRGGRGGRTVCPLEMSIGMVGGRWTPAAARLACGFVAAAPGEEATRLLSSVGTMAPSASHLDRLVKTVGEVWESNREGFEDEVRQAEAHSDALPDTETVATIVVSIDGIMVPMKDAPRTPGAGKRDQEPKGHKEASSASLTLLGSAGNRLHTIYLGRMPESKKVTLQAQLTAELAALLKLYPDAAVQAVADGADDIWRIISEVEANTGCSIEHTLDFYHAFENVAEALRVYAHDHHQAADDIAYWRKMLRDHDEGPDRLLRALKYRLKKARNAAQRGTIQKKIRYVEPRLGMMNYAALKKRPRLIGSGIQEAACKTLIAERLKRSGMSWRHQGAQAILTLRAARRSGRAQHLWDVLTPAFRQSFKVDSDTGRLKPRAQAA